MHSNFKSNKIIIVLCSIIAALFIIMAAVFGAYKVVEIRYDEMMALELPDWQGVINIWHIDSFRTPGMSKASALRDIAKAYEKKNRGIFIEIQEITPEEYIKRISEGKNADIVSFPAEMNIDISQCPQIIIPNGFMPIHEICQSLCGNRAAPWLWTMPMVVVNEDFAMKKDIEVELDPTIDELNLVLSKIAEFGDHRIAANEYAMTSFVFSEMNIPVKKIMTCWQAWQAFSQKEAYVVFGGLWEIAAMERMNERNKGFGVSVMQIPENIPGFCWTQWICITSVDEKCIEFSRKFIEFLISGGNQKKVADSTGCLSVLSEQEEYQGYRRESYYRKGTLAAIIPGRSMEPGIILQALVGDELARAAVISRLAVIENTNSSIPEVEEGEP